MENKKGTQKGCILKDSFLRIKNYKHCECEEKYENISVFLVFFAFIRNSLELCTKV